MKIKNIILLILISMLLSGCSVNYKLTINENNTAKEEVKATFPNNFYKNQYSTKEEYNKILLDYYSDYIKNNNYEITHSDDYLTYNIESKHDNLESLKEKPGLWKQYFDKVEYSKNKNIVTLEAKEFSNSCSQCNGKFNIKRANITISVPFKVIEQNADFVKDNLYTWAITDDTKDKNILIKYDTSITYKEDMSNKNKLFLFATAAFISILIIFFIYIISLKNKNNKI